MTCGEQHAVDENVSESRALRGAHRESVSWAWLCRLLREPAGPATGVSELHDAERQVTCPRHVSAKRAPSDLRRVCRRRRLAALPSGLIFFYFDFFSILTFFLCFDFFFFNQNLRNKFANFFSNQTIFNRVRSVDVIYE
jgi:hypothetical protein